KKKQKKEQKKHTLKKQHITSRELHLFACIISSNLQALSAIFGTTTTAAVCWRFTTWYDHYVRT
ncbi:MAG: hypothetical protein ABJM32_07035, partial [Parasphingorhabdus sp.]